MGNRAVITTPENYLNGGIGIYVHWNGGYDSVSAFLKYCELRDFRSPDEDFYGFARLTQIIANYFGGGLSIGIDILENLDTDNGDNGVYLVENWKIVGREYFHGREQTEYDLVSMVCAIDKAQPRRDRLGNKAIKEKLRGDPGAKLPKELYHIDI